MARRWDPDANTIFAEKVQSGKIVPQDIIEGGPKVQDKINKSHFREYCNFTVPAKDKPRYRPDNDEDYNSDENPRILHLGDDDSSVSGGGDGSGDPFAVVGGLEGLANMIALLGRGPRTPDSASSFRTASETLNNTGGDHVVVSNESQGQVLALDYIPLEA
eukprot:scaffold99374_cov67-Cyclotella_meneghiniana.AAC.5